MNGLHEVVVSAISAQGRDQRALRLQAVDGELPRFCAGAHVDVHLHDGLVRQYSIASSPQQRDHYLLCVRLAADSRGGSRRLCQSLQVGDRLWISAPRNLFALQPGSRQVLIAGGIGITPLLAMAEELDARGAAFVLHYYVHSREQIAFSERWQRGFQHGRVLLHVSTEGDSARSHIPLEIRAATSREQLYLCGPTAFMRHFAALSARFGWTPPQLHQEHFGAVLQSRIDDHGFEVELVRSGRVVQVPAQRSIAQALREDGVSVPVSCEQGICGACLTAVVAGQPEHRDSVLGQSERLANRQVALCCSRSHSPRLVLDL